MLRTASLLTLTGLLALGSCPWHFQTGPPACYRDSWLAIRTGLTPAADDELTS